MNWFEKYSSTTKAARIQVVRDDDKYKIVRDAIGREVIIEKDICRDPLDKPDGKYDAVHSGYVLRLKGDPNEYSTKMGIRGRQACSVIVHNGIVDKIH